jgi:uncharacterized protein YndB with AHSA1/START domain
MKNNILAKSEIKINAPAVIVWKALTDPAMIKQYLFGTEVITDWKEGSPITYRGVWQGKSYVDKGKIVKIFPEKLLETTYWSGMSNLPDIPENYKNVIYTITSEGASTRLAITQDGNVSEAEREHSENNWTNVLSSLKMICEK